MADDDTPRVRLDVGVVLAVLVDDKVGLLLRVCVAVLDPVGVVVGVPVDVPVTLLVAVPVAVHEGLAPNVKLPVAVGE